MCDVRIFDPSAPAFTGKMPLHHLGSVGGGMGSGGGEAAAAPRNVRREEVKVAALERYQRRRGVFEDDGDYDCDDEFGPRDDSDEDDDDLAVRRLPLSNIPIEEVPQGGDVLRRAAPRGARRTVDSVGGDGRVRRTTAGGEGEGGPAPPGLEGRRGVEDQEAGGVGEGSPGRVRAAGAAEEEQQLPAREAFAGRRQRWRRRGGRRRGTRHQRRRARRIVL